jgi:hypothetical protein
MCNLIVQAAVLDEEKTEDEPKGIAPNLSPSLEFGEQVSLFLLS